MTKNFHNGTNIIAKHDTVFLGEEILEFFMALTVNHILVSWRRRLQPFNLEQKVWVIEKFWKHILIQCQKIHQEQTFFLMGQKSLLTSVIFPWEIMKLMLEDGDQASLIYAGRPSGWF
jgi:hypothetical protein